MSKIVAFREAVMQSLRDNVTDLREVDWYDGIFNQDDVSEWTLRTPSAFVAVMSGPSDHYATGEMAMDLRVVVAIVDQDHRSPRDADERVWGLCEQVSILANLNTFGIADASAATKVKFRRFAHPELRHEGVAIGVVEWQSTLTIGRNRVRERDFVYHQGVRIDQTPLNLNGKATLRKGAQVADAETMPLPTDDEAFTGSSTLDRGVTEQQMVNDQKWESPR